MFATVTGFRIICSKVMILVLLTYNSVEKGVRYNVRNESHHFEPSGIIVTSQSALKHLVGFGFGPLNLCGLIGRSI